MFGVALAPFPAYCAGSKKALENKPFKRSKNRGKLKEKHMVEVGKYFEKYKDFGNLACANKKFKDLTEKYNFNPIKCSTPLELSKFKNAVIYKNYDGQNISKLKIEDFLKCNVKKRIFESGSIGLVKFNSMLKFYNISAEENVWNKEVFPLESGSCPGGVKLVLTNTENGNQLVFLFEFGNVSSAAMREEYDLKKELKQYDYFINTIKKLNPADHTKMGLKSVEISDVKKVNVSYKIKCIAIGSFIPFSELESVEISDDIESVGEYAFNFCQRLKRIVFKGKVLALQRRAFDVCSSLEEVELPEGLCYIGKLCFKSCWKLKKVTIPSTTWFICFDAFERTPFDLKIFYLGKEYNKSDFFYVFAACGGFIDYSE